ncbi:uncharacterized protein LOC123290908 [Chrysoperla carnea]|uniref:uncharacterized protein LOC123290908 n=1 Tax=Chrysoperla carnea TaxID=189513 RepID=UPI001D0639F5|nr:uncharacterized protein LOC123290908 [Chrysoperla carnea]
MSRLISIRFSALKNNARLIQNITRNYVSPPIPPHPDSLSFKARKQIEDREQKRCLEEHIYPRRNETPPHTGDRKFKHEDFPSHMHDEQLKIEKKNIETNDPTDPIHKRYPKQEKWTEKPPQSPSPPKKTDGY